MDTQPSQLQKPRGPEVPPSDGLDRKNDSGFRLGDIVPLATIPLFFILFCVLTADDVERPFESYPLLFVLNTLFLSALPLVVSYYSVRGYMASGHVSLLMLGYGALSLGLGSFLAALTPHLGGGPNTIVTMHDTSALLSALFNVSGAAHALGRSQKQTVPERRQLYMSILGVLTVFFLGSLLFGVLKGLTPPFFVQGVGPTHLRQVVLGSSIGFFAISATLLGAVFAVSRSRFTSWYWMGLALIAVGLMCVVVQKSVGSDVGWLGRSAQSFGITYLLVAVLTARTELRDRDLPFVSNLWTFFISRLELVVVERTRELAAANHRLVIAAEEIRTLNDGLERLVNERTSELAESNKKLFVEIAERDRIAAALRESENRHRAIFDGAPVGILVADRQTMRIRHANQAISRMLGYAPDELTSLSFHDIHPKDRSAETIGDFQPDMSEVRTGDEAIGCLRKDGTVFYADVSTTFVEIDGVPCTMVFCRDVTERKRAEEKVNIKEKAIQTASSGIAFATSDGVVTDINESFLTMWGFHGRDEAIGTHVSEYWADAEQFSDAFQEFLQEGIFSGELKGKRRPDGTTFDVYLAANTVYDEYGAPLLIMASFTDITQRKRTEEKLRRSEANLRSLVNAVTEPVFLLSPDGGVVTANEEIAWRLGTSADDLIGSCIYDYLPPDVAQRRRAWVDEVVATGNHMVTEDEHRGFHLEYSIYPVFDERGAVVRLAVFALDVTSKKKAKEALRESEERFRSVFESATECISISDRDSRFTHVNPAFSNLFGIPDSEIIGMTPVDLYGQELGEQVIEINERVLQGERITHEQVRTVSGTPIRFQDIKVPLKDDKGNIAGICCLSRYSVGNSSEFEKDSIGLKECLSPAMQETLRVARSAAFSRGIVLLLGESGCGKDHLARWIHENSRCSSGPFLAVNCAALPKELAESELFGHELGAFTGARVQKRGQLEMAEGGTLLLNEIGELDLSLQAKLLSFLDTSSFLRVGGQKLVNVSARLLAATHRNLQREVAEGRFLAPLFYRLSVIPIRVPPLRERLEDIPMLAREIMARVAREAQLTEIPLIDKRHLEVLSNYHWPGNVRELRNVIERSLILWRGGRLKLVIGEAEDILKSSGIRIGYTPGKTLHEAHQEVTKYFMDESLHKCEGDKTKAAQLLGISRDSFYRYFKKLNQ